MKKTIAQLKEFFTCDDELVRQKYYDMLESFWHKDIGSVLKDFSFTQTHINLTFVKSNSDDEVISIPILHNQIPFSFIEGISDILNTKVNSIPGKSLSTHDFTQALKTKLESLINYVHPDKHQISEIDGLQPQLDNKVEKELGKSLSTHDFTDQYKFQLDTLAQLQSKYLSIEKEGEVIALGGIGNLMTYLEFNGSQFIINKHLIGSNWLEIIMVNSGPLETGVDSPYKIRSMRVHKLFAFLTVSDAIKSGTWTDYTSVDSSPYIAHTSTRSFTTDDTLQFSIEFEGDLELFYVGDTDGGIMEVIIDNLPPVLVDTYSENANDYRQSVFVASGLELNNHTITIRNTGTKNPLSTNYQTWFNAFRIHSKKITPDSPLIKLKKWKPGVSVNQYQEVVGDLGNIYLATSSGITGTVIPSHTSGSVSDGVVSWEKLTTTSFEIKDFNVLLPGSELEYAYKFSLTDQNADSFDVGGNVHGNEYLSVAPELLIDGAIEELMINKVYVGDNVILKQSISCFEGDYLTRTDICNVEQLHQFSAQEILVNLEFKFLINGWMGYFYTAMFPFTTYDGPNSRKQFYKLSSPQASFNLIDYESEPTNLIIGNQHDYIAYAEGNAFVPRGTEGIPSNDLGEGKVLIALKCDSKSLNNYQDSSVRCGLAVNTNQGDFTGYETWQSKIYFQSSSTNLTPISQGHTITASNKYYVKLY